ncbi:hypothetical protein [Tautonia plasticadhaerens]|uniref:MetA-pathway of phenol degradation n=1 Tax=Tautonia plasticadhaerens TaxID=2527974 RepID=A0A518H0R4_9BACT|nr:hypothetical protein [Tautonia plasticadhaerens]QDV34398.1 hypothetical protein ElP_22840 [Tautonia plasticadhaerens]
MDTSFAMDRIARRSRPNAGAGLAVVLGLAAMVAWGTTADAQSPAGGRDVGMSSQPQGHSSLLDLVEAAGYQQAGGPTGAGPPPALVSSPPRVVMGPLGVIAESICGPAPEECWSPLSLHTFFTEGWDTPFAKAPPGTNGAPKQNWIGTPAGTFGRFVDTGFFYTNNLSESRALFLNPSFPFFPVKPSTVPGNQYAGYTVVLLPLSARMEVLFGTAFITSNRIGPDSGYRGNWGDTGVQARLHLVERRDFSLVAAVGERIPTGNFENGSGINYVTPALEFWWNFAPKWVARGGTSINILTAPSSGTTVLVNQLSVGRYVTGKEAALKDLVVHLTADVLSDVAGNAGSIDDVYLQPGFRFGLGEKGNWGCWAASSSRSPARSPSTTSSSSR